MRRLPPSIARRGLCVALSMAFLVPPNLLLAQEPADEVLGGPLAANEADSVADLSVLDALDVDPITGSLLLQRQDLVLGEGPDAFVISRTYKPWTGDALNMGHHWVTPFDVHLDVNAEDDSAHFTGADGLQILFRRDDSGSFQALTGRAAWIQELDGHYVVGGLGDETRYLFDAEGWLQVRRTQGAEVRFFYDAEHRLLEVSGSWGKLTVERDDHGAISALRAPGRVVRYLRNDQGQLTRVERDSSFEQYDYDPFGRLWRVADGLARIHWDDLGRVRAIAGDGVHPVRLTYQDRDDAEVALQVTLTRDGSTEVIQVSDDARRIRRWAEGCETPSVSYMDDRERLVRHVTADQRETRFRYDERGRLVEQEDASGATRFRYGSSATDQPTRIEQPEGQVVELSYDEAGRLTRIEAAGGRRAKLTYEQGRVATITDARGNVTRYTYDAQGYVKRVEDTDGTIEYHRDGAGRIKALKAPDGRIVRVTRDALGRVTQIRDGRGVIRELEFDGRGRVVRRQDELGRKYHYTWNERGDLTRLGDALGVLETYEYDESGQVVARVDGAGNRTTLERPDRNTLIVSDPSFGTRTLTHDDFGRLVHEQRGPHTLDYEYDARGRLVGRMTPAGEEQFEYDAFGRVTLLQGPQGGFALEYDTLGRVKVLDDLNLEQRIEYDYNELGDRTGLRLPWGQVSYEHDAQGRVEAVVLPGDQGRIELAYDEAGHRSQIRYPNGVVTDYRHERGQLVAVETRQGEELLDSREYGYDLRGRMAWSEDSQGRTDYQHDVRGRLTSEQGPQGTKTYAYDGAGNRIAVTVDGAASRQQIQPGNRVVRAGDRALSYGPTGALTQTTQGDVTTRYVYDHDDKLVEVRGPDGEVVRYGYAPNGTRLWRQDGEGKTDFLNDLADVVGEFVDGELQTSFVHGPGVDDVLSATRGTASFFYHRDLLGSVTAMTGADGDVAARYRYDAFGNSLSAEGQASTWNTYRYTGRTWDAAAGVYDYRARTYDPGLGRFTSPDPIGTLGGSNLYAYVLNDPTQFTDPYGLKPWWKRVGEWTSDVAGQIADGAVWLGDKALDVGKATVKGAWNVVTNPVAFGKGFVKGVYGAVVGLGTMILHPVETYKGIAYAIDHWDETKELFGNKWEEFKDALHNDPERFSEMMGHLTADIALAVVGTKGIDKLAKLAKLAKVAQTASKLGGPVVRMAGTAGKVLATKFPRTAAIVQRSAAWSASRTLALTQRGLTLQKMGWVSRQGRRVVLWGGDLLRAGQMIRRSPLAYGLYTGRRVGLMTGGLVTSTLSMGGKVIKFGAVPGLLTFEGQVMDSMERTRTHENATAMVYDASTSFMDDVEDMTPAELEQRLRELAQVERDYRNQLFRPLHAEDGRLQAELGVLNDKVLAGELTDDVIDARIAALFSDYSSRRLNHMAAVYTRGTESDHDAYRPSPNRLMAFMDEIELYKLAIDELGDSEQDQAKRKLLEQRIADLQAMAAYENELFKQGEHEALLGGIDSPPEGWLAPEGSPIGELQGLIDPAGAVEGGE